MLTYIAKKLIREENALLREAEKTDKSKANSL